MLVDEVYLDASHPEMRPAATLGRSVHLHQQPDQVGTACRACAAGGRSPRRAVAERIRRARDVIDGNGAILAERLATLAFCADRSAHGCGARTLLAANTAGCGHSSTPHLSSSMSTRAAARSCSQAPRHGRCDDLSWSGWQSEYDLAVAPGHFFEAPAHFRLGIGGAPAAVDAGLTQLRSALDAGIWK